MSECWWMDRYMDGSIDGEKYRIMKMSLYGNTYRITGPMWGWPMSCQWIPLTNERAINVKLCYVLCLNLYKRLQNLSCVWIEMPRCSCDFIAWVWYEKTDRDMMTSSNGNIFCVTGLLCGEFQIKIRRFSFRKVHLQISSARWQPFSLGLNVLTSHDKKIGQRLCLLLAWKNILYIVYIDGLVQDCSNSIANALDLLQSCIKPSI